MDPATLMALASAASSIIGGLTGSKGETKSSYGKKQQGLIDEVTDAIRSMRGGAQDITQQPGYQQGNEWLMNLFNDPNFFNAFEAPLQRQFQEQTVPDLANRFASMGSGGALGSTGFRNQLAREGSNLSTNIAALRGGLQQQGVNQSLQYAQQPFSNLMSLYQQALQPTQNVYQPPSPGLFGGLAAPFAQGAANIFGYQAGQAAGNPQQQASPNYANLAVQGAKFPGQYSSTH